MSTKRQVTPEEPKNRQKTALITANYARHFIYWHIYGQEMKKADFVV